MPPPTRFFIGSSSRPQSLETMRVLTELLEAGHPPVTVVPWPEGFRPGKTHIETLERIAAESDFVVLVLGHDDDVVVRRDDQDDDAMSPARRGAHKVKYRKAPRDNVIFELGLFSGLMGRERCIAVYDETAELKLPSDIAGWGFASYMRPAAGDSRAALATAVDKIRQTLEQPTPPKKPTASDIAAWQAIQRFSRGIAGHWWSKRDWDRYDTISFVTLSAEANALPKVSGRVFRWDGARIAEWASDGVSVLPSEGKLHYHFTGYHIPSRPRKGSENSEEYLGFSEYVFDAPLDNPMRGRGRLWDVNLRRHATRTQLTMYLERCIVDGTMTEEAITAMAEGRDRSRIAEIV